MKHVTDEMTALLERWRSNGFNEVEFDECRVEGSCSLEDFIEEGKTEEDYKNWLRDYAACIISPIQEDHGSKYDSFDIDKFNKDVKNEMLKVLGKDVKITYYCLSDEYEIQRM